jgi:hypothetical protein
LSTVWLRRLLQQWLRPAIGAVVLSLLGLQLAVAAYACPQFGAAQSLAATTAADSLPDCHGQAMDMDPELAPLCAAHCQSEASIPVSPSILDQLPLPTALLGPSYVLPAWTVELSKQRHAPGEVALAHAWAPPLFLSLQVFRN